MEIPKKFAIGFQEGVCQLSCNKCAAFGKFATRKKEIGRMNIITAKKLIDEIAEIGGKQIQPSIYTEPFMNTDLKEIILYCNQKSIALNIITNGILIDEEWENFIVDNMKEDSIISISLDAVKQSTYEKVRGNYSLDRLEKTIIRLIAKRKGRSPRITVSFSLEEDNKDEKDLFVEKWKNIVDAVRINTCFDNSRKIPEQFKVAESEYKPCTRIMDVMTIDYNGEVRVCQVDAFGDSCLGNVFEEGVLNVWNKGDTITPLRERHYNNSLLESDFCYGCEAGKVIITQEQETEDFLIKKGPYLVYYNRK